MLLLIGLSVSSLFLKLSITVLYYQVKKFLVTYALPEATEIRNNHAQFSEYWLLLDSGP